MDPGLWITASWTHLGVIRRRQSEIRFVEHTLLAPDREVTTAQIGHPSRKTVSAERTWSTSGLVLSEAPSQSQVPTSPIRSAQTRSQAWGSVLPPAPEIWAWVQRFVVSVGTRLAGTTNTCKIPRENDKYTNHFCKSGSAHAILEIPNKRIGYVMFVLKIYTPSIAASQSKDQRHLPVSPVNHC